ncbi:MAG: hypothetical protein NTW31_07555 [Bacteroidetes bacterium]|nr:hypothetical protein [Bacteroidota bacterium]
MKRSQFKICLSLLILFMTLGLIASAKEPSPKAQDTTKTIAVAKPKPPAINFQDLIGKWHILEITVQNIFEPAPPAPAVSQEGSSTDSVSNKPRAPKPGGNPPGASASGKPKSDVPLRQATIEFLPDKTAFKAVADKSEKFTWKTKKKNKVVMKNLKTKEKTKLDIFRLNSDTLKVIAHIPSGDIFIVYQKVK